MYPYNMKRDINLNTRTATFNNYTIHQQLRKMINLDDNFYVGQLLLLRKSSPGSREAVPPSKTIILLIARYLN